MSLTKTVGLFAGTTLALTGAAFGSNEANNDALKQIADLKAEIAAMKAQSGENWLTEQRAEEIKGLVQDVLADADTRASLQGAGSTAGWDNGFFISSADGNFRLNINGGAQLRWTWNHRSVPAGSPPGSPENNWGFSSHFASMSFSGHIVDPSWKYKLAFAFFDAAGDYAPAGGITGGDAYLTDWWVMKDMGGWYLKGGQFVAPFSRERLMSDYSMQFLDRSNLSYVFGLGRTQGIEVGCQTDWFRSAVALSDGVGFNSPTQNAGYGNLAAFGGNNTFSPAADFSVTGRLEVKLAGNWSEFEDHQSWRGEEFGLLLGIGGFWNSGGYGNASWFGGGTGGDFYGFTADAAVAFGGFNIEGALYYQNYTSDWAGLGTEDFENMGFVVSGGFFLTDNFELVGRFEYGDFGGGSTQVANPTPPPATVELLTNNLESIASVGANWYFAKNRAKWQSDIGYSFNSMGAAFGLNGNGWTPDYGTEDGQWLLRTGVTISF